MNARERARHGTVASVVGICVNVALAATKGIAGFMVGSIALVADATNNLMDATASIVTLVGFRVARRPADTGHPYGHGRMEYLAGLCVAILVLIAGVELVQESVGRIISPTGIAYGTLTLCLLVPCIVAKLCLARYDHRMGQRIGSDALEAASKDACYDAIATSAVLAGAVVSQLTGVNVDSWLGLAVGLFVLWGGIGLVRDTVDPLLGKTPDTELVERVRTFILAHPHVLGTHDLMMHDYGPGHMFASAHVEMPAEEDPLVTHEVLDAMERELRATEGLAIVLHYDPVITHASVDKDVHERIEAAVSRAHQGLTIHDLRMSDEGGTQELWFDCVRPATCEFDDDKLRERVAAEVARVFPRCVCHVTIDAGYVSPAD